MAKNYIYFENNGDVSFLALKEVAEFGIRVVLCSSFAQAEGPTELEFLHTSDPESMIFEKFTSSSETENPKKEHFMTNKKDIFLKIDKIPLDDATSMDIYDGLIGIFGEFDLRPVLLANQTNRAIAATDIAEVAFAHLNKVNVLYKIPDDQIELTYIPRSHRELESRFRKRVADTKKEMEKQFA